MRTCRRTIAIALLVFETLFLNVIVPGHTRGVITLAGARSSASLATADVGCEHCRTTAPDSKKTPTRKDTSECAICHLAARITAPLVVDFRLTELGLCGVIPVPPPELVTSHPAPMTYDGRAPPSDFFRA